MRTNTGMTIDDLLQFETNESGTPFAAAVKAEIRKLVPIASSAREKAEAIRKNAGLNPIGRKTETAAAVSVARGQVKAWRDSLIPKVEASIQTLRQQLITAGTTSRSTDGTDRLVVELRAQEVRRIASTLTPEQQVELYRKGNADVRAALTDAPSISAHPWGVRVAPFVTPEIIGEVAAEDGAKLKPETAAQVAALESCLQSYRIAAGAVERELDAMAGGPEEAHYSTISAD